MQQVQCNECLVSTVATDGVVLLHQGKMQCSAVITRSMVSQIFIKDTP